MEPSSILMIIAIILLGVIVMGGGTMSFCCYGFERGLPFFSYRDLTEELNAVEEKTVTRFRDFVQLVDEVTLQLQQDAAKIQSKVQLREISTSTILDMDLEKGNVMSVGCQITPNQETHPLTEVAIAIPEV